MTIPLTRLVHPNAAGGWRWAVHLAHPDALDTDRLVQILNAGHAPDEASATVAADVVFQAVGRALLQSTAFGIDDLELFYATWPDDPITGTDFDRVLVIPAPAPAG